MFEFFNDSLMFLLFQTEEKPFPFKNSASDESAVIDAESEEIDEVISEDDSEEKPN